MKKIKSELAAIYTKYKREFETECNTSTTLLNRVNKWALAVKYRNILKLNLTSVTKEYKDIDVIERALIESIIRDYLIDFETYSGISK